MTQGADTVSVVMPVYNGVEFLAEALRSVLDQTYAPHEIIVVDDGSTDSSGGIVQQVAADSVVPLHYVRQENQGPAAARNRGIVVATGNMVAFLDQDDLWLPTKLARQIDLLRQQPHTGYSITLVEPFLQAGISRPTWLKAGIVNSQLPGYLPSCLLVWQETFRHLGLFDPALWNAYDIDWFIRANDSGITAALVPEVLVRYRIHEANQSRDVRMIHQYILRTIHTNILRRRNAAGPIG